MMKKIATFLKREIVLVIASAFAIASAFLVPPSVKYIEYIDFSVLAILFCLMAVVAGFIRAGLFDALSERLLTRWDDTRVVSAVLVLLCFFSAMLVTNDVALITFVPLTIAILGTGRQKQLVYIIALQAVAANLGSMLTPIGNPQNLYIYSFYNMEIGEFFKIVLPVCAFSLLLILGFLAFVKKGKIVRESKGEVRTDKGRMALYSALFLVCLASVLRVLDYRIALGITVIALLIFDRKLLGKIDYALLGTFVAFFIFVGNLGNIGAVKEMISGLMTGRELFVTIGASQVISNVPAAIMLSNFTNNVKELLLGVNIGGLGTLIASLASLIAYKLYAKSQGARPMLFLGTFTAINIVALVAITGFTLLFLF